MKTRLLTMLVLVPSLLLLATWSVSAQGPKPTATPQWGQGMPPASDEPSGTRPEAQMSPGSKWDSQEAASHTVLPMRGASMLPLMPRIAMGQPGLSFRYLQTFGVTGQAYPAPDNYHLNAPGGLFIDGSNNLFVTEDRGYRVLEYNSAKTNILALGVPGWCVGSNGPIGFCTPQDVGKDASGNIWVADGGNRVVQFDASGNYLQQLPPSNSWYNGTDNTHFSYVTGLAFDNTAGRMFVADASNHRVQVYTFSGSNPVYDSTIGETGVYGNDNNHLNYPRRLAVDNLGRLYIADSNNNRVQRCTYGIPWTCMTLDSGLRQPYGVAVDSAGNAYVADTRNARIRKCTSAPSCSDFITGLPGWTTDVAVDSAGNVYLPDGNHHVVRRYTSGGVLIDIFVGTADAPYTADNASLNMPWGIAVAADNSIYVAENNGFRLIKLNAAGVQQWTVGTAGIQGGWNSGDNTHFSFPQGIALDSSGRIYVADSSNNRIQIYNSNGSYSSTFGSYGNGALQLSCPAGIAISPVNGDVYIADRCNHRIQVYNSTLTTYKATLGTTGSSGSDATRFNNPYGVAVDSSGYVYVADSNNHRIQKCTVSGYSGTCTTFIGQTGWTGNDFGHLNTPYAAALDKANRLYVVDRNNNRIQVFDSSGAYLTTVGGSWGANTGQLRGPAGMAFDSLGNVYVTDRTNSRIQKFAIGVPGWQQMNINGFGDRSNVNACALVSFGGQLYAGTNNQYINGSQLWRMDASGAWTSVFTNGFGDPSNSITSHLAEFSGKLYASTGAWDYTHNVSLGARVFQSGNGSTWSPVTLPGLTPDNGEIPRFAVFNNKIYASTWSYTATHGAEIWSSATGTSGDWAQVVANGRGNAQNVGIPSMAVFNSYLYAAVHNLNTNVSPNTSTGSQVWRTNNGTTWSSVNSNGFGNTDNYAVRSLAVFNGRLYAGTRTYNYSASTSTGGKIYRCSTCDGTDWAPVVTDGFGDTNNQGINGMIAYGNALYAATTNSATGTEIWRTTDGNIWTQLGPDGFGNSNNTSTCYSNSLVTFNNRLYIGATNGASGGQLWMMLNPVYLPMLTK